MFYHGFFFLCFFLLLSFFRRLISELTERNSTKIGHMLGSNCNLKTPVQNLGYLSLYKPGVQKPPFGPVDNCKGPKGSPTSSQKYLEL